MAEIELLELLCDPDRILTEEEARRELLRRRRLAGRQAGRFLRAGPRRRGGVAAGRVPEDGRQQAGGQGDE